MHLLTGGKLINPIAHPAVLRNILVDLGPVYEIRPTAEHPP